MTTYEGIKRVGPPQAIQKLREDLFMVQIALSETPTADWKRLFYETQQAPPPDFLPRAVEIISNYIRFRSEVPSVQARTAWIDRWIDRANQKEASMGGRWMKSAESAATNTSASSRNWRRSIRNGKNCKTKLRM